ncbi:hypothetical protein [Aquimarina aquimarini]|uniref:hypothetical protein n=1 Tax=Aquimarina aquimarini TaxID=1191734 RepID=UPI00131EF36F|nr:hypothetical protein [Aquimarina aquimarini]
MMIMIGFISCEVNNVEQENIAPENYDQEFFATDKDQTRPLGSSSDDDDDEYY